MWWRKVYRLGGVLVIGMRCDELSITVELLEDYRLLFFGAVRRIEGEGDVNGSAWLVGGEAACRLHCLPLCGEQGRFCLLVHKRTYELVCGARLQAFV